MSATIAPPMRKAKKTKRPARKHPTVDSPNCGPRLAPPESACRCPKHIGRINAHRLCCTYNNSREWGRLPPEEPTIGPCTVPPIGSKPDVILSAAPGNLNMLSGFMFHLSNTQLRKSWKPLVINALAEELDASGALYKHKGLLANFMQCLEIVHNRFVRIDGECLDPNTDTPSR